MKRKGKKLVCLALSVFLGLSVLLQPLPAEALQKGKEQAGVQQDGLEQLLNGTVSDSDVEVNGDSTNLFTSENTQMIHVDEDVSSMVYQAGGFGTPAGEDYGIAAYAVTSQEQLKNRILEALKKGEASIDVSGDGLTMDDRNEIQVLYAEVLNENPELFYVQTWAGYSYNPTTNAIIQITFKYNDVTEEQKKAFNDKLAEAAALVTSEMSTAEKALVLHDYLAQHCAYAYQEYKDGTLNDCPNVYDAYGALVNGKAVCQGYALAYQAMLQKVGIRSYICSSDVMSHAWNVVEIDGRWYHVDVTWDDPVWNREGRAMHSCFLLSDAEMGNRNHSGWVDNVECDSATYDSYWWKDVDSQIVQVGHEDYIYVKNVNGKFQLTRRTNDAETAIYASDSRWNEWGNPNLYYTTAFAYLSRLGDYIYFNDNLKLYSLNLSDLADAPTVEYTYGQNDGYIYGAMVCENGKARLNICKILDAETDSYIEVELREVVRVSDVTLSQSTASVKEGETLQLTAVVTPENAENRKVTWSSSDPEVASVGADGTVTAKKAGTVTITVTTIDGGKTASCTVTVTCSHVLTETAAVNATCGTTGNIAYWTCGKCQKIFSDQEGKTEITINDTVTPATGQHEHTEIRNAKAATEESEGYTGDTYCKDCNQKVADGKPIPRLPHTHAMTKTDAVAAACETDGNVEYWTCSKCGRKYADAAGTEELADVVIRAKGHVPGAWNSDETNHWKECTVCNKEIDKAAHTFQWVVDKAATEDETGLSHEECVCGVRRSENTVIPKLDHVHIGIQHHDAVAATCTTKGSVEYWTCSSPKCAGKCYGDSACQIVLASTETPVNPNNHAGAGYWSIDDVKHVYICSCGVVLTDGAHVYDNDMDHDCNQCGYKRFYVVINGANVVYETDSESDLVITANGEYKFFQSVEVDGKAVDKANYEVKEGSTIVTLKKAYLDTLSMGTHDFRVLYTDGKVASTQFTLQEKAGTDDDSDDSGNAASTDTQKAVAPKTGDMNQPVPLAVILVVCAFMIAGILVSKRRKCYR